jgi:hypothetical protein
MRLPEAEMRAHLPAHLILDGQEWARFPTRTFTTVLHNGSKVYAYDRVQYACVVAGAR